jgi:hypothetical protein
LPNLRLRDLDGETIAYARLADSVTATCKFVEDFSRRPWSLVNRRRVLLSTLKRIWNAATLNPVQWYLIWTTNFRTFIWARSYDCARRAYLAGEYMLDPQYYEYPDGISSKDWKTYFEPIRITDDRGFLCEWLEPYANLLLGGTAAEKHRPDAKLSQQSDLLGNQ